MNKSVKVSVIVPVYNAEKYLKECIQSICNQTLKEIEIICVDDGSTDDSLKLLYELQEKDERIQVYHQENLYAGMARNNGMNHAIGEFLVFWDSDDFFYETALEKMYLKILGDAADVCVCDAALYLEEKGIEVSSYACLNKKRIPKKIPFNIQTNPEYILNFTNVVTWNKMFRRDYIEENGFIFKPARNGEDAFFVSCALCKAENITVVDEILIRYRVTEGSTSNTAAQRVTEPIQIWIETAEKLKEMDVFEERSFVNRAWTSILALLRKIHTSWPAFEKAVALLKNGGLEKLGIVEKEEYYYEEWKAECLHYINNNSAEEFLMFYLYSTHERLTEVSGKHRGLKQELKEQKQKIKTLEKDIKEKEKFNSKISERNAKLIEKNKKLSEKNAKLKEKNERVTEELKTIEESMEYRLGKILLWLPRKFQSFLKKK